MRDKKVEINRRGWKEEIRKEIILARTRKLRERERERKRENTVFRRALARGYDVPRAWLVSSTFPVELR